MVKVGHLDRGVHLFRSASEKQSRTNSLVHVLHMAHAAVQQVHAVAKKSLKMQFDGYAGVRQNLQPARLLLDTGAESFFISEDFVKRCSLSVQAGAGETVTLADGRQMPVQMTAKVDSKSCTEGHSSLPWCASGWASTGSILGSVALDLRECHTTADGANIVPYLPSAW